MSEERAQRQRAAGGDVAALYGEAYAALYDQLYIAPWRDKHELNAANIDRVLRGLANPAPRWLDLACGQSWHFAAFAGRADMVGVDLSEAQLIRARAAAPRARFLLDDISQVGFAKGSFDLVTNFWAGYCYLRSRALIAGLFRNAVSWIAPGGALYLEVLLGADLASFNSSRYAQARGFTVAPRSEDYGEWQYDDVAGRHLMTSPPVEDFLAIISPEFASVEALHDGRFMVHLIATGRR